MAYHQILAVVGFVLVLGVAPGVQNCRAVADKFCFFGFRRDR